MATDTGPGEKIEDLDLFYEQVKNVHGRGLWQTQGGQPSDDKGHSNKRHARGQPLDVRDMSRVHLLVDQAHQYE